MEMQRILSGVRTEFLNIISGTIIVSLNIIHRPVFLLKTQSFGDWILSLSSAAEDETYFGDWILSLSSTAEDGDLFRRLDSVSVLSC
jgi:hypothetical protein